MLIDWTKANIVDVKEYDYCLYTKFTINDGNVTHENVNSPPNGIGIWPNDDGTIDLYYETWEDTERIKLMERDINKLHRNDFKYTCIEWEDHNFDIHEYKLNECCNRSLPHFNHVIHDETDDSFSCVIIGNCEHDINFHKDQIKNLALEYYYANIEQSELAINKLLEN